MLVKAGLLIDFGNSESRVTLIAGHRVYRFNLSNRFALLPPGYTINNKYANGKSTVFQTDSAYYANGQIVEMEFSTVELRPSALQSKTEQITTELTINLAIIKSLAILSQVYHTAIDQIDVSFKVSALLPPLDHEVNEERLAEMFRKVESVSALMPYAIENKAIKIEEEIGIYSEAVAAFFGAYYKEEGMNYNPDNEGKSTENGDILVYDNGKHVTLVEVENNKKFEEGYVLVLDIGAGTTDVALFLNMELIESSKDTFNRGGNTVSSLVFNEIRKKYRFAPPQKDMEKIIKTGQLAEGSITHDVSAIVTKAKNEYSSATTSDIRQYLERMAVALPVVKGLLVAGGGALPSMYEGKVVSPSMAEVLVGYLKQLAPRIEALDTEGKNLRELNIDGLGTIHKYS